jgi:hypothetical protein
LCGFVIGPIRFHAEDNPMPAHFVSAQQHNGSTAAYATLEQRILARDQIVPRCTFRN